MSDIRYQNYQPYAGSPPDSSSSRFPRMSMPSPSLSSLNSQQARPPSPTSFTGLLRTGSHESQPAAWDPAAYSYHQSFNGSISSQTHLFTPEPFETGYGGAGEKVYEVAPHSPPYQLLQILGKGALRWLITVLLCGLYYLTVYHYGAKVVMDEGQKRRFNTWTVALSIVMGLNMASSFKEMALNLRWWLLSHSNRDLNQVDLILRCDSLQSLTKLLFKVRTTFFVTFCIVWLLLNIVSQVGIAMLSLTYGIETEPGTTLTFPGNVSIPDMGAFYPNWNTSVVGSRTDQEYLAHTYGLLTLNNGFDTSGYSPAPARTWTTSNASIWLTDPHTWTFIFLESPPSGLGPSSVFTNRTISATWSCLAQPIIKGGDGTQTQFSVQKLGLHNVTLARPNATIFYTNGLANACANPKNNRCAVVQAFEASEIQPWYYSCDITISEVGNARADIPAQHVGDEMAWLAAGAIALEGYGMSAPDDPSGPPQQTQLYPNDVFWGWPREGDADLMGKLIALFAIGSITGAALNNPPTYYNGMQPVTGQRLNFTRPLYFFLLIGFTCGGQLLLLIAVSVMADRVTVRPDSHVAVADVLRPIVKRVEAQAGPYNKKTWKRAGKGISTRYIRDPSVGWKFKDV